MYDNVKCGSVLGTGAAINVELGFLPDYVRLFNYSDAGKLYPTIEWWEGMTAAHGLKTLSIADSGTSGEKSQDVITSGGVSRFAGEAPNKLLTGTVAATDGSTTLTGTDTLFLTELRAGDKVKLADGQEIEIASITDATTAVGKTAATASVSTKKAVRIHGRSPGFIVGNDSDMNASGEKFFFLAIKNGMR